jgi:hypothetical protein
MAPLETATVDILFPPDALLGELEGSARVEAPGVWNSPQDVSVALTVPEPGAAALGAAALLVLLALTRIPALAPQQPSARKKEI